MLNHSLVRDPNSVVGELWDQYNSGMTYSDLSVFWELSKGTIWRVMHGHEPSEPSIRAKLGLAPCLTITTQYQAVRVCRCGQTFVPNTAKRRLCFKCTPFRRRKEDGGN